MRVAETYECKRKHSNVLVKPRHTVSHSHSHIMDQTKSHGQNESQGARKFKEPHKSMEDSIVKSRGITLPTKTCLVKAMVFPIVVYECESWTIKKTECWRIDAFQLWCWRRLLRVPWTARSSQSILKEINAEYSLQGLMLNTPILWPPDAKNWCTGKDPDAGKDWRQEEKWTTGDEMVGWHHRLDGHDFE